MRALTLFLMCGVVAAQGPSIEMEAREIRAGDVVYSAETGRLSVPENRAVEDSRSIRLAVGRLLSTAADPGPPLFFLPGGPGNDATSKAASPIWKQFLEIGDVILMDPRGVGRSEPEMKWESADIKPELFFTDRETAVGHMAELCEKSAAHYAAEGVDLRGYNTIQMADDVDDLRRALGYDQVNVIGHSYGTHLALALMRRHPGTVARFVSVGTAGTDDMMKVPGELDSSLRLLAEAVAADATVGEAMPDLYASVERVVADLKENPLPVPVAGGEVQLGSFGLQLLLLADLGDTSDLPVFPALVHSLEQRDPSIVRWFLAKRLQQFSGLPMVMLTVRGASGASPARWERIRREAKASPFGMARCLFSPEADVALGVADVGKAFRQPVSSDVPTLFVSGTLDAHTPPAQAQRVRAGFANSGHLVVQFGGHEDLVSDSRVRDAIAAFLAGAAPRDVTLPREPLRFAAIGTADPDVRHPALDRR